MGTKHETPLEAVKRSLGGNAGVARAIGGITSQAVSQWRQVPPERVLAVEGLTGISRHDLRPDIFGASPVVVAEDRP